MKSWTRLSDFTFTFHFHALQKEMATHSSALAWRIPGTGEPSGLPSMGSHRVGHDWSNLAATYDARIGVLWSLAGRCSWGCKIPADTDSPQTTHQNRPLSTAETRVLACPNHRQWSLNASLPWVLSYEVPDKLIQNSVKEIFIILGFKKCLAPP